MFERAIRRNITLRLALCGPSGSGKTYSALLIASGIGGRIAMIDTENGSGELYAGLCPYDILRLDPPYTPQRYIEAIAAAERAGYQIVIVDSLSPAWSGPGGIVDQANTARAAGARREDAWREPSREHARLLRTLLQSPCHVIVTLRSRPQRAFPASDREHGAGRSGRTARLPQQRPGIEYEFTTVLELSETGHLATATKDRTGLFDGREGMPTRSTGERLAAWLNLGQARQPEASARA